MLLDSQLVLSDDQAITGTAASTHKADLGAGDVGSGNRLGVRAHVTEAFNLLTSLKFGIRSDTDSAFGSPKVWSERTILLAGLTLGVVLDLGVLPEGCERYVDVYYTVAGTNPSTGKLTTYIAPFGSQDQPTKA